jgi:RNA polymerase sigma-70 factor, ECF subfamily
LGPRAVPPVSRLVMSQYSTLVRANTTTNTSKVDTPQSPPEVSDETLLSRITTGDCEALGCLFHRYARLVRGLALRILRDRAEAEDLLQELFLFIHRKSTVFDSSKSSARSWIVQMTYHRAIDRRRYLNSRHFYTHLDFDDSVDVLSLETRAGDRSIASDSLVGIATMEQLFDTLTEDQRHTLNLYFYEGYTFDEIALQLKQSLRNVRNHYYRGLDKLRKQMSSAKLQAGNGCGKK